MDGPKKQINATCVGKWCPASLKAMNVVGFGIRAGVVPYIPPTNTEHGKVLFGTKKGKYTDFGGGCKINQKERPFDCAQREFNEESLGVVNVNPLNITHILVTGKKAPHQIILMIAVTEEDLDNVENDFMLARRRVRKSELEGVNILTISTLKKTDKTELSESLYKVRHAIERIISRKGR
jgi:hypothetical protein